MMSNKVKRILLNLGVTACVAILAISPHVTNDSLKNALSAFGGIMLVIVATVATRFGTELTNLKLRRIREINDKDERLNLIRGKAARKANIVVMYLLCAAMIAFTALNIEWYVVLTMGLVIFTSYVTSMAVYSYYDKRL
jgi:hypothetical protein